MVSDTTPEPALDIAAQMAALDDPAHPKQAVFVARGTEPVNVPAFALAVEKPAGTLYTFDASLADAFATAETDRDMAKILGYPQAKEDVIAAGEALVVQARDRTGGVVFEAVASPRGISATIAEARRHGSLSILTTDDAHARRRALLENEQ